MKDLSNDVKLYLFNVFDYIMRNSPVSCEDFKHYYYQDFQRISNHIHSIHMSLRGGASRSLTTTSVNVLGKAYVKVGGVFMTLKQAEKHMRKKK